MLVLFKGELFESCGILKYSKDKLIVEVDKGLSDYYYGTIPKYFDKQRQMYSPHISVVRKEIPPNMQFWGKYEGKSINFLYSNYINQGTVYFWLNAFCKELEDIRIELGLPVHSLYTLPPEGFVKCFHITLGNLKKSCEKIIKI